MIEVTNKCCDCESSMKQCDICSRRFTETRYCDDCGDVIDGLYYKDSADRDLCSDCAREYMLELIDNNLDTQELYEMMSGAGFDELEKMYE